MSPRECYADASIDHDIVYDIHYYTVAVYM
jgi:hypothetical protein